MKKLTKKNVKKAIKKNAKVAMTAAAVVVATVAVLLSSCAPVVRGTTTGLSACVDANTPCQFDVTQLGAQGVKYTWFVKALGQTSFQTQVCEGANCQQAHNFVCDANTQVCADQASLGIVSATRTQEGSYYKFTAVDPDPLLISVTDSFFVRATTNAQAGTWVPGRVTVN